ncbi:MAG: hypothetical protein ABIX01_13975 [Chitinophagaceae bacterium]
MLQAEILEKIKSQLDASKNNPKYTLIVGLVMLGIAAAAYIGELMGGWSLDGLLWFPFGAAILTLGVFYPLSFLTRSRWVPHYEKAYDVIKTQPRSVIWAYKLNRKRNGSLVSSSLVLCSNRMPQTCTLNYYREEEVDDLLMRMPMELNPAVVLGYTTANKKRFLK